MEEMKEGMKGGTCGCKQGCGCYGGGGNWGGGHHHHGPWRILVKILILVIVFWVGMQFGELRAYRGEMGRGGYGGRGAMMGGYGYGYGAASNASTTAQ